MNIIIEIIFRGLIINCFGLYTRFYFFKLTGTPKSKKYLSGDNKSDMFNNVSQHVLNIIIGFIVFAIVSYLIVYLIYS